MDDVVIGSYHEAHGAALSYGELAELADESERVLFRRPAGRSGWPISGSVRPRNWQV